MDGRTVRQKGLADAAGPTGGPKGTEGGQGSQQEARDAWLTEPTEWYGTRGSRSRVAQVPLRRPSPLISA